jgi:glucose-6-phosphate 1-dehydrogenase
MVGQQLELLPTTLPGPRASPYARLLNDAMSGDAQLFATEEAIEAQWAIVDPILGDATPLLPYEPGTWGPPEAEEIIRPPIGWRNPEPPREAPARPSPPRPAAAPEREAEPPPAHP